MSIFTDEAPSAEAIADADHMLREVERQAGLGSLGPEGPDVTENEADAVLGALEQTRLDLGELQRWRKHLVLKLWLALGVVAVLAWSAGVWWAGQ